MKALGAFLGVLVVVLVVGSVPAQADPGDRSRAVAAAAGPTLKSMDPDAAGKCLDSYDWGRGPWIQMWACHGGSNQTWTKYTYLDGTIDIFTQYQGSYKCVDGASGRGHQVFQWTCDGSPEQRFTVTKANYEFTLESVRHRGQCLDIRDWGRAPEVMLFDCNRSANQFWFWG